MNFDADLSPDELKVFLEEANEQIELMDEDIVRLEKEGDDPELLQEIFRAAHTIKGSSAMIGFQTMAELTHSMESLLDKLRNKALSVSTEIIDALLFGLDILKLLMDSINSSDEDIPDINPAIAKIKEVSEESTPAHDAEPKAEDEIDSMIEMETETELDILLVESNQISLETEQLEEIENSLSDDENMIKISVLISEDSDWPAVRFMQIFNDLNNRGEVIKSSPTEEEIEEDSKNLRLEVVFKTTDDIEQIEAIISSIGDISSLQIIPFSGDEQATDDLSSDISDSIEILLEGNEEIQPDILVEAEPDQEQSNEIKASSKPEEPTVPETEIEAEIKQPTELKKETPAQKPTTVKKKETSRQETSQSVRVDVQVLDSLLNVVEELVIDRSKISQVGKMLETKYPGDELIDELSDTSDHIIKTINELQEYIMQARMVPIGTIFSRFPRMVRDLAQSQSKKLDFNIEGSDTELDRTIIEQIRDPLTHLLRNAVDHGIEPLEERIAAGKPETAKVTLNAYREQSHIFITVQDDGKGINPDKIKETAIRKGLITPAKAESLSETEAINLIFMAGMSTTEKATEVSGRGVGMDIVRANVESLGGTTAIETKAGEGSKFIIKLPLTVAIVQGFLISVSQAIYILPMGSIAETVMINNSQIQTIQGRQIIRWRDSLIPLIRLDNVFNNSVNEDYSPKHDNKLIVIVNADNYLIGLEIDELLEQQQIVVKSLGNYLGDVEGIAGATILGDGKVALILDISSLIKKVAVSGSGFSVADNAIIA